MIYQKNMIHSSHYSRFWNKQHIGWQDILRKRNGAQLRPASLPCRGAWFTMIIIFQRHFRIEVSPWVKPKGGENIHVVVVCVCQGAMTIILYHGSSTPSVYGSRAESARNMEFVHVLARDFATMSQLPARSFFQCFLNRLVVPVSSCFNGFFLVVSEAPWHNNPRDIVNIVGSGAFAALCWDQSKAAVGWTPSQCTLESVMDQKGYVNDYRHVYDDIKYNYST